MRRPLSGKVFGPGIRSRRVRAWKCDAYAATATAMVRLEKRWQGVAAVVSAARYADTEKFLAEVLEREQALLVALDRVQDPRNLGAILRTAAAAGADGVIVGGEGSVGLTATVAKTSAA